MNITDPREIARHPIGVVTERTGLSAHVLRAWERRYEVVKPHRGEGGHRLYSDADVERLMLLQRATRSGRSVASVVGLPTAQLQSMVEEDAANATTRPTVAASYRDLAMAAVRALAPEQLGALLRRGLLSLGAIPFLEEVIGPLMVEVGTAWHAGEITVAQEHAATAVVTQQLGALMRDLEPPDATPHVLLATPAGERHALGALMAGAAAAHDGWHVTWLGPDLPASQIATAAAQGGARVVALSLATEVPGLHGELAALRRDLASHVTLIVGGAGAADLVVEGVTTVRDLAHWRAALRLHATGQPA